MPPSLLPAAEARSEAPPENSQQRLRYTGKDPSGALALSLYMLARAEPALGSARAALGFVLTALKTLQPRRVPPVPSVWGYLASHTPASPGHLLFSFLPPTPAPRPPLLCPLPPAHRASAGQGHIPADLFSSCTHPKLPGHRSSPAPPAMPPNPRKMGDCT